MSRPCRSARRRPEVGAVRAGRRRPPGSGRPCRRGSARRVGGVLVDVRRVDGVHGTRKRPSSAAPSPPSASTSGVSPRSAAARIMDTMSSEDKYVSRSSQVRCPRAGQTDRRRHRSSKGTSDDRGAPRRADRRRRPVRRRRRLAAAAGDCPAPRTRSWSAARRSAAPGTCSGTRACGPTRTCSRSPTRSGRGRARSRSPPGRASGPTSGTPPTRPGSPSGSGSAPASCARRSPRRRHCGRSRRRRPTAPSTYTASFLYMCSGYYAYDQGYQPEFPGPRGLRRHMGAPAVLAGGPGLRRQDASS